MAKLKLKGEALKFFQKVGSKGGKSRAKKHSPEQLRTWASLGGRPKKKKRASRKKSNDGPKSETSIKD